MARTTAEFVCSNCLHSQAKWSGQCPGCGEWNTMAQQEIPRAVARGRTQRAGIGLGLHPIGGDIEAVSYMPSGITEFDRVLGGGLVPGAAILLTGEPGVGKSTLLMQLSAALSRRGKRVVYVSGEESHNQVRMRAHRLGFADTSIELSDDIDVYNITQFMGQHPQDLVMVIDSIQTMRNPAVDSMAGSISQVRESSNLLIRACKQHDVPMIIVCHQLKDGGMAGPKQLEHAVDVVMDFSGERDIGHRILRAGKNRFGSTDEVGVFEMAEQGLVQVENPSGMLLHSQTRDAVGSVVFPTLEGSRVVLLEIQALVARSSGQGNARRSIVGWDAGRLAMVLAVLEARCGIRMSDMDIFLNVAGGFRLQDPAADFAVAAALMSSFLDRAVPTGAVFFGEVGLSGELRPVRGVSARLRESSRLGFQAIHCPPVDARALPDGIRPREYRMLVDYVATLSPDHG